jgi:sterol desaturase/sphingolipid hydroxylase (fatty acid hydroxylase superfamily)
LIPYEMAKAGWLPGVQLAESWGAPWFILSVILITLGHDTWFYWSHRLIHHPRLFRSFHRRHHKSRDPSPFASFSFDIGEAVLNAAFVPLWMIIVPTSWGVIGVFFFHMLMRNLLAHAGYQLLPAGPDGKPLFGWVTTVTHHDMHHEHGGYNFGLYFTFWDRWMGTENPEYLERFRQAARPWPLAAFRRSAPGPAPVNETEG